MSRRTDHLTKTKSGTRDIRYSIEPNLSVAEFTDILERSTLAERRPATDAKRLTGMLEHADVIVAARDDSGKLIGVARSITDFHYCTYLSDLAVDVVFQMRGIGRELIRLSHETAGKETTLILLAAPAAREYYPKIGMEAHQSCWIIQASENK